MDATRHPSRPRRAYQIPVEPTSSQHLLNELEVAAHDVEAPLGRYLIEEQSSSLISETRSRWPRRRRGFGVGFVTVVAVACWARGAPAWGGPSVGPQSVPRRLSRVYASLQGHQRP